MNQHSRLKPVLNIFGSIAISLYCLSSVSIAHALDNNSVNTAAVPNLPSGPGMGQTIFALLFIIAVLLGLAWALKRLGVTKVGNSNQFFKIISITTLGTREKIALVEIGETWLVLGMTASSINTLHTMPKGSIELPGQVDTAQIFAKLLEKIKKPEVL